MNLALATSAALPGLSADDRILQLALEDLGVLVEPAVWEDPHYEWGGVRACVIRSAWDYAYRRAAFVEWAEHVARKVPLWNSAAMVEWNTHKAYMTDLARRDVPIVPTEVLPAGSSARIADLLDGRSWEGAVVKAAVAQTGRYFRAFRREDAAAGQRHLDRLLPHEDMLLQPLVPSIETDGELSLVYFDGTFSHAVRKRAVPGDIRVHHDFGGSVEREEPDATALAVAERALAAAGEPLLYARVDLVTGADDTHVVMELELVEPDLFFGHAPGSAGRLARIIAERLP